MLWNLSCLRERNYEITELTATGTWRDGEDTPPQCPDFLRTKSLPTSGRAPYNSHSLCAGQKWRRCLSSIRNVWFVPCHTNFGFDPNVLCCYKLPNEASLLIWHQATRVKSIDVEIKLCTFKSIAFSPCNLGWVILNLSKLHFSLLGMVIWCNTKVLRDCCIWGEDTHKAFSTR